MVPDPELNPAAEALGAQVDEALGEARVERLAALLREIADAGDPVPEVVDLALLRLAADVVDGRVTTADAAEVAADIAAALARRRSS